MYSGNAVMHSGTVQEMHCSIKGICMFSHKTTSMEVSLNEIQFLFGAVERVPEITPSRWNLISEIVQDCQNLTVSDECPKVYLGGGEKGKSFGRFCSSPKQCQDLYETLKNVELQSKEITQSIETM